MKQINSVLLEGCLTKKETTYIDGERVVKFTIQHNDGEDLHFFPCEARGKAAEVVDCCAVEGDSLRIVGRAKYIAIDKQFVLVAEHIELR